MINKTKKLTQAALKMLGYELVGVSQRPVQTFMGLGDASIKTIIDVGANEGQFAKYISGFFPDAQIHAFEPLPPAHAALAKWGETSFPNLVTHKKAVGDKRGNVEMEHHVDFTPSSSILESVRDDNPIWRDTRVEKIEVEVTTLDNEFPNGGAALKKNILLKLDVQGFEDRVLSGGKSLLSNCDIVIVEHCTEHLYEGQAGFNDIYQSIQAAGLEYIGNLSQHHAKDGSVLFADIVFTNPTRKAA